MGMSANTGHDSSHQLFEFCRELRFDALPREVVERTRLAILDTLAACLAGIRGEGIDRLTALACDWGGKPEAALVTNGRRLPLPLAGLVNGAAGRAWDLDDVHEQNTLHLNVNTVVGALAVAQARGPVSGASLIAAVAAGSEAMCRIATAPRIGFSESGSAMSYQVGFYGVALTAAKLMGLDLAQTLHAIGIAHARVAGNHQGYLDGAMTVRLMQGVAVEGGLVAALMAERGLTGSSHVLEGRYGYYDVYHRGRYEPADILGELGQRWQLLETSIKPLYPCCKFTHGPIAAMLLAMDRSGLKAQDIEAVEITVTNKEVYDLVCLSRERKWAPRSLTDAQFSLPYTVACAAVQGRLDLASFQPDALDDARVRAFLPRIRVRTDFGDQRDGRGALPMPGLLKVTDRSGRVTDWRVDHVKGHPRNPMDFDDVAEKFVRCAKFARPGWKGAHEVVEAVRTLEAVTDVGGLLPACAPELADSEGVGR